MRTRIFTTLLFSLLVTGTAFSQRPPRPQGLPGTGGPPPRGGEMRPPMNGPRQDRPDGPPNGDWLRPHDQNDNGILEADEFTAAMERTFGELDRNGNGTIEVVEARLPPKPPQGHRPGPGPGQEGKRILPPFFFIDRVNDETATPKAEFERIVRGVFAEMDKDGDGTLAKAEARKMPPKPGGQGPNRPLMGPNAQFIAAELRFGDKRVMGQPFSAESVIEDTRRLFDGSTVTQQRRGSIYRDTQGRTRREQTLEMAGGVILNGDNKPAVMVFINDFAANSQIFLDLNNKTARKSRIGDGPGPLEPGQPDDAKTESLGTKMIEGVKTEGTRVTFQIPVGHIGNDKPIEVVSERWFSPELQVLVMSRHIDPIAGEHVFKLVNIRRSEPAAELFVVPSGFRIETRGDRSE